MGEQRHIRTRSWNRMPTKRCSANGIMDEFIVVDDDEVIVLDTPESSKFKASSTSRTGNESVSQRVISIDDDDDDVDTENVHKANLQTSAEVDNEDCQNVQEESAAFRFSKCNQTSSTMPSSGTRFGLGSEYESDFSDSDCSDCEILEGSQGEVREQWEKAFAHKMKKSGLSEEAGPSGLPRDPEQHDHTSFFFPARNPDGRNHSTLFGSKREEESRAKNFANTRFSSNEDDAPSPRPSSQSTEENQKKQAAYQSYTKEVEEEEEDTSKSSSPQISNGDGDTNPVLEPQSTEAKCENGIGESREPIVDSIPSTSGQVQEINGTAPAIDIILDREKLKETDEYKKALEEELESRKQQLQIQAEEAQRLRKRRKIENTRQLEMERRQKERVEEVRETQKKDEESMNMKEKVRAEITKTLQLLELKCINMASLLRGLGIHVSGGTSPLPNDVHAAYKRAVLKFHPDRTSRGDIKQQVEAEEKFKLIARMKDKFKFDSCH